MKNNDLHEDEYDVFETTEKEKVIALIHHIPKKTTQTLAKSHDIIGLRFHIPFPKDAKHFPAGQQTRK